MDSSTSVNPLSICCIRTDCSNETHEEVHSPKTRNEGCELLNVIPNEMACHLVELLISGIYDSVLTFRIREPLSFHHRREDGAGIRGFGVDQRKVIYVGLVLWGQTLSAAATSVESI